MFSIANHPEIFEDDKTFVEIDVSQDGYVFVSASIGCRTSVGYQNEDEFAGDFVGRGLFISTSPSQ